MADVFLSYARPSAKAAKLVAGALRASGYSVWFDESLPAHRAYTDVIQEQLESARAVIVLWSTEAVRSQWVRSEANRARETGRLVQVRLDDSRLPMPFDQIHCLDLTRWLGNLAAPPWQGVVASVAALADREPTSCETQRSASPVVFNRRFMLIGGTAATGVAAGLFAAWRSFGPSQPSAEAQLLFEKGTDALQSNDAFDPNNPAAAAQAIAILTNATRLAPDFATAWGALAMAYAVRKKGAPPPERAGFDARSRSAAKHALELEPREARAIGALRMLDPVYGNWLAAERADREALKVQPRMPLLLFLLADVLGNVGRWGEAAALSRNFDRKKFLIAGADRQLIINLWSAGDLPGADDAVRLAVEHWPQHPQIWRTRLNYLMYSGRPLDALDLLRDQSERPPGTSDEFLQAVQATATALAGQSDPKAAVLRNIALLKSDPAAVFVVAHGATALADTHTALALLRGYYFGEGEWARLAPVGGDEDRQTAALFQPPMRNLWRDPIFDALLERIGLNAYWRRSGTKPDFRKRSEGSPTA
jgi:tetratricopeptide (TPR) repeat protein